MRTRKEENTMFIKKQDLAAMQALLQAQKEAIDKLTAETALLRDDCLRYRDEAKRYRNEARTIKGNCYEAAGRAHMAGILAKPGEDGIPMPPKPVEFYEAGESAYMLYHTRSNSDEMASYLAELEKAGFEKHTEKTEGANRFAFYKNGSHTVSVSFAECDKTLRVIVEPLSYTALAPTEVICDGLKNSAVPCLVQQSDHLLDVVDCGLSYIFRLSDGCFILIDGGYDNSTYNVADALYERLVSLSEGRPIVVSAWLFTHAHGDHIQAAQNVARKYADKITVKRIVYNFPGHARMIEAESPGQDRDIQNFRSIMRNFRDVEFITARTGQTFHFEGLDLDVLLTYEDYQFPRRLGFFNDTTVIFRVTTMGEKFMFLGDASETENPILVKKYGELLKSDVVQIAHHGYEGGTKEVYDAIAARYYLFPCSFRHYRLKDRLYWLDPNWSPIARNAIRTYGRAVYPQCEGTRQFYLPMSEEKEF
jgi:hypothetical protein